MTFSARITFAGVTPPRVARESSRCTFAKTASPFLRPARDRKHCHSLAPMEPRSRTVLPCNCRNNSPKSKNDRHDHKSIAVKAARTPQRKRRAGTLTLEKVFFNDETRVLIRVRSANYCRLIPASECAAISWQRQQTQATIPGLPKRLKSEMAAYTAIQYFSDPLVTSHQSIRRRP